MIARRLARVTVGAERRSTLTDREFWESLGIGSRTNAGVAVNEESALGVPAVYSCIQVVAEDIGKLPLLVYERTGARSREPRHDHPYARLLGLEPNPEMGAGEFWESIAGWRKLWNRAYAYIERATPGVNGRVIGLWPIPPNMVEEAREKTTGQLLGYRVRLPSGEPLDLLVEDVLAFNAGRHSRRHGAPVSPIALHRESIGLTLAAEEYAARFFANDASAGGFIQIPSTGDGTADERIADRVEARWRGRHEGLSRAHMIGILEGGATWQDVGASPADAQFVESQKWGVSQACRTFRVQPHKVMDLDRATFSNIEEQNIEYVVDTLGAPARGIEIELHRKLFGARKYGQVGDQFARFDYRELLRGDILKRYMAYAIGRNWGFLSADDIREDDDRPALPKGQGETYLQPLNMVPAGTQLELPIGQGQRELEAIEGPAHHAGGDIDTLERVMRFLERGGIPAPAYPALGNGHGAPQP